MSKDSQIAARVKAFRLERQWTQTQMATFLRVGRSTIARLESGSKHTLTDLTRAKIEKSLNEQVAA